jgi:hypothetical protein
MDSLRTSRDPRNILRKPLLYSNQPRDRGVSTFLPLSISFFDISFLGGECSANINSPNQRPMPDESIPQQIASCRALLFKIM